MEIPEWLKELVLECCKYFGRLSSEITLAEFVAWYGQRKE